MSAAAPQQSTPSAPSAPSAVPPQTLRDAQLVRTPTRVFRHSAEAVRHVVLMIENLIRERNSAGQRTVLGLPTGSTPVSVYRELVRLHREEDLDFGRVVTFNLDEYFPIRPDEVQSYHRFMHDNLFDHVNIDPANVHIPDGTRSFEQVADDCEEYEHQIRRHGGLDLVLLGIGRTGHIGFNEPGSPADSRTRLVRLDPVTRRDAADAFYGEENVPTHAITMGVGTILEADKIVLMAFGEHKARIVRKALETESFAACPATVLQRHDDAAFVIDEPAASHLTCRRIPWKVGRVDWNEDLIKRAVLWLSEQADRPLLKLTADHFREHHLQELLREHGPAPALCQRIFDLMMATICNHPGLPAGDRRDSGGKPVKAICFSPHPDDDVISMGGTLIKLVDQGHDVRVAYMTSGNVAVFDHDARRFARFVGDFNRLFGVETEKTSEIERKIVDFLAAKQTGRVDSDEVLAVKGLIRKSEATAGAAAIDIPEDKLHFLDLPFYRTGRTSKNPLSAADIDIVRSLLEDVQPDQIYVAGDLADPHGTHRICAMAIFEAVRQYREQDDRPPLEVWLYRGAWQEWEPHQIERAVPLSPQELDRKKAAIFRHESQKDRAMFPGVDSREFWQRAQDRNTGTAALYDGLGLPEYFAIEGFVQWRGETPS